MAGAVAIDLVNDARSKIVSTVIGSAFGLRERFPKAARNRSDSEVPTSTTQPGMCFVRMASRTTRATVDADSACSEDAFVGGVVGLAFDRQPIEQPTKIPVIARTPARRRRKQVVDLIAELYPTRPYATGSEIRYVNRPITYPLVLLS